MENNKITSVAWLINQIKEDQTIKAKSMSEWNTVFEQAKEMHKEEIKSAYKEDRYFIHEIDKDEAICDEILMKAEKYHPMINVAYEQMANASILDEMEFFYNQLKNGIKYKSLKDYWVNNQNEVFRFENEFFIV